MFGNQRTNRQGTGIAIEDALKLLAAILAATVLAVNLSIVRPMKDRMEELKQQVVAMQSEVQLLVGERDQVRSTNDLLSGLKAQETAFEEARHSLTAMRQFRDQIESECQKTSEVLASVEKLAILQQTVLRYRDLTEPATKVLSRMTDLQKRLIEQNATADDAIDAVNRLTALKRNLTAEASDTATAESTLAQLASLKVQILSQTQDLPAVGARTQQLLDLKSHILDKTGDFDNASSAVDGLLALKDKLAIRGGQVADANQNAERLLVLRDRLAENLPKTEAAERSAARMMEVQKRLAGETPNLAESIKSIETLIDFQHEFQKQIHSLDGMRRSLMEVVMMENTVTRAVRLLQPLLELGNLRHLNEEQLRQIARAISDKQTPRISKTDSPRSATGSSDVGSNRATSVDKLDPAGKGEAVPWPTEPE